MIPGGKKTKLNSPGRPLQAAGFLQKLSTPPSISTLWNQARGAGQSVLLEGPGDKDGVGAAKLALCPSPGGCHRVDTDGVKCVQAAGRGC